MREYAVGRADGGARTGVVDWGAVREREFWELVDEVFGHGYGRSLSRDQRLLKLDGMTVVEALAAGEQPRVIWNVLCDQMDVPDDRRWGRDHQAPPLPAGFGR
ncbi:hypothetical protein DSM100688_0265 [Bifidobacterium ramosum]|uniref:DUF3046 domain-containing protein n=1 Tax=Bifidobacterium ramosum TaxID=1798158 RepID=A0A6L4X2H2_9BIFI|nr:hypothetical protein DSM100688_0265 [Bifidobacterium ramosum]